MPETDVYVIQVETPKREQFSGFYRIEGRGTVKLLSLQPVSMEDLG